MDAGFDPEEFRPDDLEAERLYDRDPEFRRLWVDKCQAERDCRRLAGTVEFRAPGQDYRSDVPAVSTTEAAKVAGRLERAKQQLKEYCKRKGLRDLSDL